MDFKFRNLAADDADNAEQNARLYVIRAIRG